jgi:DNA polymerase-3 subunit gamma/tau
LRLLHHLKLKAKPTTSLQSFVPAIEHHPLKTLEVIDDLSKADEPLPFETPEVIDDLSKADEPLPFETPEVIDDLSKVSESTFSNLAWTKTLEQLKLDGIGKSTLSHSSVLSFTNDILALELHANYKTIFSPAIQDRIQQALTLHFKRPIRLNLHFSNIEQQVTPAVIKHEQAQQAHSELKAQVLSHPFVQDILDTFKGEIIENSMTKIPDEL